MSAEKKRVLACETTPKSSLSKSMKKSSSKSRSKTPKPDSSKSSSNGQSPTSSTSSTASLIQDPPTTPTSSIETPRERIHPRGYAAFGARTIKIIWEQHDTSDTDLSMDLLPILAEDVSYKVWELAKNIKTYSTHCGGVVTSDLVNEVIKDSDCPPVLGSMDTEWDRVEYDGSFYFNSDKILELRSEYQKDVQITMPVDATFKCTWPIQGGCRDLMQAFMQSIFLITLGGSDHDFDSVRQSVYCAPFIGGCYRVLLLKIIQTLAFKQTNHVKYRCWRLMQTLVQHPCCRDIYCREEYFHLAEIFICQLLDTYEAIPEAVKEEPLSEQSEPKTSCPPMEVDATVEVADGVEDIKMEDTRTSVPGEGEEDTKYPIEGGEPEKPYVNGEEDVSQTEHVYRLEKDDDGDESIAEQMEGIGYSSYSADKVDLDLVDTLCETIGLIGATNEFFNTECMHLILRRLEKFFKKRRSYLDSDYELISRALRGLFALGEYAFREFIPFMENIEVIDAENIPDYLRLEFARCAIFLRGHDDIFLYEWLGEMCCYRLVPFMTHYAHYHQKLMKQWHLKRRPATFNIVPKVTAKRISPPPSKTQKKDHPAMEDMFPDRESISKPQQSIRFKFSGCRQIPIKSKPNRSPSTPTETNDTKPSEPTKDVIIARRKLFKPLTDERKCIPLSNYHLLVIK